MLAASLSRDQVSCPLLGPASASTTSYQTPANTVILADLTADSACFSLFFFAIPHGMQDPSVPTRGGICTPNIQNLES